MVPVVIFVYSRLDKLQKCLNALEKNKECAQTELYIYADGAKKEEDRDKVAAVRNYLKNDYIPRTKFQSVVLTESKTNKGLASSIIGGVSEVIKKYGKAIIVEDDLIVSRDFLSYMNQALTYYENYDQIGSISAYTLPLKMLRNYKHDIYILQKGECWGWGTWKDRWEKVDWSVSTYPEYKADPEMRKAFNQIGFGLDQMLSSYMDGRLDTWAVRWCYHLFRNNLLTVYPRISRTNNIGVDGTGTHCTPTDLYSAQIYADEKECKFELLPVNRKIAKATVDFEAGKKTVFELGRDKIRRMLSGRLELK